MASSIPDSIPGGTTKIYEFPAGGRSRSTVRSDAVTQPSGASAVHEVVRVSTHACNGCWYHDAAIEDAAKHPIR